MNAFVMNGDSWQVKFVDPHNPSLVDRTGRLRVATTDPNTWTVYLSNNLKGDFLMTVMIHELGHCAMYSFGLLYEIHKMVRHEFWIDAEEWICNFIADYGMQIFKIAYGILGSKAWDILPKELERVLKIA